MCVCVRVIVSAATATAATAAGAASVGLASPLLVRTIVTITATRRCRFSPRRLEEEGLRRVKLGRALSRLGHR